MIVEAPTFEATYLDRGRQIWRIGFASFTIGFFAGVPTYATALIYAVQSVQSCKMCFTTCWRESKRNKDALFQQGNHLQI